MRVKRKEREEGECPRCHMPRDMGRHNFIVVIGGRPVLACEPTYKASAAFAELQEWAAFLREVALAALNNDRRAIDALLPKARRLAWGM